MLKDFNAYYSAWGGRVVALKPKPEYFLTKIGRRALYLFILPEKIIWKKKVQKSIINLIFITVGVKERVEYYKIK